MVQRRFSVGKPHQKWLSDVTESSIPAGKVYMSLSTAMMICASME